MGLNNKGWIRIVEAFIAILLILGVLIMLYNQNISKPKESERLYTLEKTILDEIAFQNNLRALVLENKETELRTFVDTRVPDNFNFDIKICPPEEVCNLDTYHDGTFATEKIISVNLNSPDLSPKKVKIFIWPKP